MALVNCSECSHEISKKAKVCPNCGGKNKKSTSPVTWIIVLGFVGAAVSNNNATRSSGPSNSVKPLAASSSTSSYNPAKTLRLAAAKPAQWRNWEAKDEMTGNKSSYASSPFVSATRQMSLPYSDVQTNVVVGCNATNEWAYFYFTKKPNLDDTAIKDGYHVVNTRLKWGDTTESTRLTQNWGAKSLHFSEARQAISSLTRGDAVKLELQWHSQSRVYFDYSLDGSSAAIEKIRENCRNY